MVEDLEGELRSWLAGAGFPGDLELTSLHRGLGSTVMWSFQPEPGAAPLVARLFGPGNDAGAEREYLAMEAAARHEVPVPAIVTRGVVGSRSLLVTTFVAGVPVAAALEAQPERALALGMAMGETMGRMHAVAAPAGLATRANAWIDRGGPALSPLRSLLSALPGQDRLLHLDYHPANVLVDGDRITGVVDWENTLGGPPHMDLARTLAILRAAVLGNLLPPHRHASVARFEEGMVAGHARVAGDDPAPALSAAWGLAMTVEDLAEQAGRPGSPIPRTLVDRLAEERDERLRVILAPETPNRIPTA
jgi:aminoglycoside phosphotransferase (APT) family kinase protein